MERSHLLLILHSAPPTPARSLLTLHQHKSRLILNIPAHPPNRVVFTNWTTNSQFLLPVFCQARACNASRDHILFSAQLWLSALRGQRDTRKLCYKICKISKLQWEDWVNRSSHALAREYNCGIMQNIGEVEVRSHLLLRALPSLHFTELAGFGLLILCFYNSVKMLKLRHLYKLCLSLSHSLCKTDWIDSKNNSH